MLAQQKKLKALAVLETAAGTNVAGPEELFLLGDLYAEQHLVPEATATYEKALELQPTLGRRKLLQFAQVLIVAGKTDKAADVLARPHTLPEGEERIALLQTRADLLAAEKKWDEVLREVDLLLQTEPMNGRALLTRGTAYCAKEDLDHAMFAFEAAARIPATTYRATLELASIELKHRHYSQAAEYLEKAQAIEKSDAIADVLARVRPLVGNDQPSP